ncbi:hypothetical protein CCHR01_03990 [Colletotrichum chrysophilum]|uniref:Transmembrane protein n=1 Tax=Colletotrichum chrysophilum TaxID=1836956 RepID=A0AAD9ASN0_9PEZI|nr:hypothetical protein CCHR01_03990 [Colletotrichum chrysophilum]
MDNPSSPKTQTAAAVVLIISMFFVSLSVSLALPSPFLPLPPYSPHKPAEQVHQHQSSPVQSSPVHC